MLDVTQVLSASHIVGRADDETNKLPCHRSTCQVIHYWRDIES